MVSYIFKVLYDILHCIATFTYCVQSCSKFSTICFGRVSTLALTLDGDAKTAAPIKKFLITSVLVEIIFVMGKIYYLSMWPPGHYDLQHPRSGPTIALKGKT